MNDKQMEKYFKACAQPQSNYAVEHFIDGAALTPERRFRQSVIELEIASESYAEVEYQVAKSKIKIKKLKGKLFNANKGTDRYDLLSLKIDRMATRLTKTLRGLNGKRKEMEQHINNLKKVEAELCFDQDTTVDEVYKVLQDAESEYYMIKLATDTAAHIISHRGGPSVGVSLSLQQMPKEDIAKFQATLNGMLQSMSTNSFVPAIHGSGSIKDIMALGDAVMKEANTLKQQE